MQWRSIQWVARLHTAEERDVLFAASPSVMGKYAVEQARLFGGLGFKTVTGTAEFSYGDESFDADHAVAHVTKRCFVRGSNDGLGEGLVHAMTWLLCGTTATYYCDLPRTATGETALLPRNPDDWLARLQGEVALGKDWPLVQVPRERADNFRDSARVKTWTFMLWLVARFPDQWPKIFDALDKDPLQTEDVAAAFQKVFERDVGQIEAEWREWARPGSRLGKTAGFGR